MNTLIPPSNFSFPLSSPKPTWLGRTKQPPYYDGWNRNLPHYRISRRFGACEFLDIYRLYSKLPDSTVDYGTLIETTGTTGSGMMFPVDWTMTSGHQDMVATRFKRSNQTAMMGPHEVPAVEIGGVQHLMTLNIERAYVSAHCFPIAVPNLVGLLGELTGNPWSSARILKFEESQFHLRFCRHFVGRVIWTYRLDAQITTWENSCKMRDAYEPRGCVDLHLDQVYTDSEADAVLLKMIERGEYEYEED